MAAANRLNILLLETFAWEHTLVYGASWVKKNGSESDNGFALEQYPGVVTLGENQDMCHEWICQDYL